MILNRTLFVLLAMLLVVIQSTVANVFTIQGVKVELLPALVVYCAMSTSLPTALLVAFCGGLLQDVLSAARLGTSVLPLCGIAIVLFQMRPVLVRNFYLSQALLGAMAALFTSLWMALCQMVFVGRNLIAGFTLLTIFWVVVSSGLLTPFVFQGLDRLLLFIGHRPGKEDE